MRGLKVIVQIYNSGFMRKLFVTLLLLSSMNRPHHVWYHTWCLLADDIMNAQKLANNRGTNLNGNSYILKNILIYPSL